MYKILVVDDEPMIRMGIKNSMPWDELKIDEVFTASSGSEGLEIIREHKPDIMITDIFMSEMTGIELITASKEIVPGLKTIVITGYDRFDYARDCLRLHVEEFLLKPIDEEELATTIKKQVSALSLMDAGIRAEGLKNQLNLEKYLRELAFGKLSEEKVEEICSQNRLELDETLQQVIIIPKLFYGVENDNNLRTAMIRNVCVSLIDMKGDGITFTGADGTINVVLFVTKTRKTIKQLTEELDCVFKTEFDFYPRIVVGSKVVGYKNLYISYNDARMLFSGNEIKLAKLVKSEESERRKEEFSQIADTYKLMMCESVESNDVVIEAFEGFCEKMKSYNISDVGVRRYCFEMASAVCFSYVSQMSDGNIRSLNSLAKSLVYANSGESIEITLKFISELQENDEKKKHQLVIQAKRYIQKNLEAELSVNNISAFLYVTPSYFSRLFKAVTGEGCNEYIVRKRMEKAIVLLETTSLKTGRIASLVGYNDTNYFSHAFKKNIGKSPTQYRDEFQK